MLSTTTSPAGAIIAHLSQTLRADHIGMSDYAHREGFTKMVAGDLRGILDCLTANVADVGFRLEPGHADYVGDPAFGALIDRANTARETASGLRLPPHYSPGVFIDRNPDYLNVFCAQEMGEKIITHVFTNIRQRKWGWVCRMEMATRGPESRYYGLPETAMVGVAEGLGAHLAAAIMLLQPAAETLPLPLPPVPPAAPPPRPPRVRKRPPELGREARALRDQVRAARKALGNRQSTAPEGYVYVLSNPAWPGLVKIGKCQDQAERLSGYQTSDPHRAYVMHHAERVPDRALVEKAAHLHFAACVHSGEWFHLDPDTAIGGLRQISATLGD